RGDAIESMAITQKIRCYNPADFRLLLEGTGLRVERIEVGGEEVSGEATSGSPIWKAWSYLAVLKL
ncbi:MAG TPA: hypothetical protein VG944_11415, partial [Fimbriimonas sp.]|nr:hypothetical protein [Fimbriimonas sp.]